MRTDKSYMIVIPHFKLYPAFFPLKWFICIPNISAVRGNVVFETLHDFYQTAIIKKQTKTPLKALLKSTFEIKFSLAIIIIQFNTLPPPLKYVKIIAVNSHFNTIIYQYFKKFT